MNFKMLTFGKNLVIKLKVFSGS